MSANNYELRGTLTLTAPCHVTPVKQYDYINAREDRINPTHTSVQRIAQFVGTTDNEDEGRDALSFDDEPVDTLAASADSAAKATTIDIPNIPGNSIRGALRRSMAAVIKDHLRDTGATINKPTYYGLTNGSASQKLEGDLKTLEAAKLIKEFPFTWVLGTGVAWPSHLQTYSMVPILQETIGVGLVPESFLGEAMPVEPWKLTEWHTYIRGDDMLDMKDPQAPTVIADYDEKFPEWATVAGTENAKRKAQRSGESDDKATGRSSRKNLWSPQTIIAGTRMYFRLGMTEHDDACLGMVLKGLEKFATTVRPSLGGLGRLGFGRYRGTLDLVNLTTGETIHGAVTLESGSAQFAPQLTPAFAAFEASLTGVTPDLLHNIVGGGLEG